MSTLANLSQNSQKVNEETPKIIENETQSPCSQTTVSSKPNPTFSQNFTQQQCKFYDIFTLTLILIIFIRFELFAKYDCLISF